MTSRKLIYRLAVLAVCAALAYLSTVITLSNVVATRAPTVALGFWPVSAVAHARLSDSLIGQNPARPPIAAVRDNAVAALRRNPTLASAVRDLALLAALRNDLATADRIILYADAMSRRDVPTQMWLIERNVAANNVTGALAHYGVALRVAPETSQQLFPVLASALSDPNLVLPITRLVRDGDSWRSQFLYFANVNATSLPHLARLYLTLGRMGATPAQVQTVGLLSRMIQAGDLDSAAALYVQLDPRWQRDNVAAQLNGGFDHPGDSPPLGWEIADGPASRGDRPGAGGNPALLITIPDADSILAARRLMLLPAGAYRFTANYGRVDGAGQGRLRIALACMEGGGPPSIVMAPIPQANGRIEGVLQASGCRANWLSIGAERVGDPNPVSVWMDDLSLTTGGGEDRRGAGRQ